jgi:FlaA1/EpsC-like NDP-sugar epimerase
MTWSVLRTRLVPGTVHLRRRLVTLDAVALGVASTVGAIWSARTGRTAAGASGYSASVAMVLGFVAVGLPLIMLDGLYLARIAAGRQEEIKRIVRTMVLLSALAAGATELMRRPVSPVSPLTMVVAGAIAIVLLVWCRGGYRAWLDGARARGLYQREVIVLGTCADAAELVTMFDDHPEAGYTVRGVVGDASDACEFGLFDLYLGSFDDLEAILGELHIDGVIAIAGGAPSKVLSPLLAHLESTGIHVQYSNGLLGTSPQRLRATPVAFQSLYYVEPSCGVESPRLIVKRLFDVVFATFLIIVTAPLMIAIALAISLTDSGPVLFRHQRAGRGGGCARCGGSARPA